MGLSKAKSFGERENRIAGFARALAHPARVAILEFLAGESVCVCGKIVDRIPLSQATISQHLAELKKAGLIRGTIEGPRVCYCIDREAWGEARALLGGFLEDVRKCC